MAAIDVEALLTEISPDQPAGEDLEYDPAFGELERSAQRKPDQEFGEASGEKKVIPGEEPDWGKVKQLSLSLFSRTRDLRVGLYLARATLRTDGVPGFRDSLRVIEGLVTRFWDTVHPALDPDDDNDPTMRMNVVGTLCNADTVLRGIREAPLVAHRTFGRFSLRDLQAASGQLALPEGQTPPDSAAIDAAFMEIAIDELEGTAQSVTDSIDLVQSIEDETTQRVGVNFARDLSAVRDVLGEVRHALTERLARRGVVGASDAAEDGAETPAGGASASGGPRMSGDITCREDVIRVLEKAADWLRRNEPANPVPLLLERARRLIGQNFLEILRDLAPDGLAQAQNVTGVREE